MPKKAKTGGASGTAAEGTHQSSYKKALKLTAADKSRSRCVVGPEQMHLLEGKLCGREVRLYLCGESHEEAIDVTRKGGKFFAEEGFVETRRFNVGSERFGSSTASIKNGKQAAHDTSCGDTSTGAASNSSTDSTTTGTTTSTATTITTKPNKTSKSNTKGTESNTKAPKPKLYNYKLLTAKPAVNTHNQRRQKGGKQTLLPLVNAEKWADEWMNYDVPQNVLDDPDLRIFFLWKPNEESGNARGVLKGRGYIVGVSEEQEEEEGGSEEDNSDGNRSDASDQGGSEEDDDSDEGDSVGNRNSNKVGKRTSDDALNEVLDHFVKEHFVRGEESGEKSGAEKQSPKDVDSRWRIFEWDDLDDEARLLNKKRLQKRKEEQEEEEDEEKEEESVSGDSSDGDEADVDSDCDSDGDSDDSDSADNSDEEFEAEHDCLIQKRIEDRKKEGLWTWDSWVEDRFFQAKREEDVSANDIINTKTQSGVEKNNGENDGGLEIKTEPNIVNDRSSNDTLNLVPRTNFHLILEEPIPPWELELHETEAWKAYKRKNETVEFGNEQTANDDTKLDACHLTSHFIPEAPEFLRAIESDSDESDLDRGDAATDGCGTYSGFVARKFYGKALGHRNYDINGTKLGDTNLKEASELEVSTPGTPALSFSDKFQNSRTPPHWLHAVDSRDIGSVFPCFIRDSEVSKHIKRTMHFGGNYFTKTGANGTGANGTGADGTGANGTGANSSGYGNTSTPNNNSISSANYRRSLHWSPEYALIAESEGKPEGVEKGGVEKGGVKKGGVEKEKAESVKAESLISGGKSLINYNSKHCLKNFRHTSPRSIPSLEAFFGQVGDVLAYNPNVKVNYAPLLSNIVGSYDVWKRFCIELLFGGTIDEAFKLLGGRMEFDSDLNGDDDPATKSIDSEPFGLGDPEKRRAIHVRSPVQVVKSLQSLKCEGEQGSTTPTIRPREFGEGAEALSSYFMPINAFMKAKKNDIGYAGNPESTADSLRDADPLPTTWSSELFRAVTNRKCSADRRCSASDSGNSKELASKILQWTLQKIEKACLNPRDWDEGETLGAYLRAVHRKMYDDIDHADHQKIQKAKTMRGNVTCAENGNGRKQNTCAVYNVGEIQVPAVCPQATFGAVGGSVSNVEKSGNENVENSGKKAKNKKGKNTQLNSDNKNKSDTRAPAVFSEKLFNAKYQLDPEAEVLSKILIDIWWTHVVDFCTALRIVEIAGRQKDNRESKPRADLQNESDPATKAQLAQAQAPEEQDEPLDIVIYMGGAHTDSLLEFFRGVLGFRLIEEAGKPTAKWGEEEPRKLKLSARFWSGD